MQIHFHIHAIAEFAFGLKIFCCQQLAKIVYEFWRLNHYFDVILWQAISKAASTLKTEHYLQIASMAFVAHYFLVDSISLSLSPSLSSFFSPIFSFSTSMAMALSSNSGLAWPNHIIHFLWHHFRRHRWNHSQGSRTIFNWMHKRFHFENILFPLSTLKLRLANNT